MKKISFALILALAACGSPESPEELPIVIIDDEPSPPEDAPPEAEPDPEPIEPPDPTCSHREVELAVPAGVQAISVWDTEDAVYAAWVRPTGASVGEVAWAKFSPRDGRALTQATRAGAAILADQTNWAGGHFNTSIAVNSAGNVVVAWNSKSTTYIEGGQRDHSQVVVSSWDETGRRTSSSHVASDDRFDDYVVDADRPRVYPFVGGFAVTWRDRRLNEPRVYGQQGWPTGIYRTTYDSAGNVLDWDQQVQQSPSIRAFDVSATGHVFLSAREPYGPAFGRSALEEIDEHPSSLVGNSQAIAVDATQSLMAWSSSWGSSVYVTAQRSGGEPFLVHFADDDAQVRSLRFLRGQPLVAYTTERTDYSGVDAQTTNTALVAATLSNDGIVARKTVEFEAGVRATVLDGSSNGDSARVLIALRELDGADQRLALTELCLDPANLDHRLHVIRSSEGMSVSGYDEASVSLNASVDGLVSEVHVMTSAGRPEGDWVLSHRGIDADPQQMPSPDGLVGQSAAGIWTLSVRADGRNRGFQNWALQLIVED